MRVRRDLLSIVLAPVVALTTGGAPVVGIAEPGDPRRSDGDEPAASPDPTSRVTVVENRARWDDVVGVGMSGGGLDPSGRGGPEPRGSFYLITGTLRNETDAPLRYVKLVYELLDVDGNVVHREYGYNRKAEPLREEAFESGGKPFEETGVEPLAPGETETFRMFFFEQDLPPFEDYRVTVQEAVTVPSAASDE